MVDVRWIGVSPSLVALLQRQDRGRPAHPLSGRPSFSRPMPTACRTGSSSPAPVPPSRTARRAAACIWPIGTLEHPRGDAQLHQSQDQPDPEGREGRAPASVGSFEGPFSLDGTATVNGVPLSLVAAARRADGQGQRHLLQAQGAERQPRLRWPCQPHRHRCRREGQALAHDRRADRLRRRPAARRRPGTAGLRRLGRSASSRSTATSSARRQARAHRFQDVDGQRDRVGRRRPDRRRQSVSWKAACRCPGSMSRSGMRCSPIPTSSSRSLPPPSLPPPSLPPPSPPTPSRLRLQLPPSHRLLLPLRRNRRLQRRPPRPHPRCRRSRRP